MPTGPNNRKLRRARGDRFTFTQLKSRRKSARSLCEPNLTFSRANREVDTAWFLSRLCRGLYRPSPTFEQVGQFQFKKAADAIYCHIRRWIGSEDPRIFGELSLPGKHCRYPVAPIFLDRRQNPQFVVHHDVVFGWVASHDVLERFLLVNVDKHVTIDRLKDAGALDLARLVRNFSSTSSAPG
jgi:hypothetical protein